MKAFRWNRGMSGSFLMILSLAVAGCQSSPAPQGSYGPTVASSPALAEGLTLSPRATTTIESTNTASDSATPESTSTMAELPTPSPSSTATIDSTATTADSPTPAFTSTIAEVPTLSPSASPAVESTATSESPTPESTSTIAQAPTLSPSATAALESTATTSSSPGPESFSAVEPTLTPLPAPLFDRFVASITNGQADQVVGVFVDGVMALRVVQQPASDPAYVSTVPESATYFTLVTKVTGNTGLLAHNYLGGVYYYNLRPGQQVTVIHGDGSTDEYVVSGIDQFQALSPNSTTSNFVSLSSGETLTATDLFYLVYGGSSRTTFQTCIAQGNDSGWGRLFVIAPLE